MGLFNKFIKNKNGSSHNASESAKNNISNQDKNYDLRYFVTPDGRLVIEFEDHQYNPKQFYDTTRLIIDNTPTMIDNFTPYNCFVSWYGSNDAVIFDKNGYDASRRSDYSNVLAEIDPIRLQQDSTYCSFVMRALFKESRVKDYLAKGLIDNPSLPCGNYIGGVRNNYATGRLEKCFSTDLGRAVHFSPSMNDKRNRFKQEQQEKRQEAINKRRSEIDRLNNEIDKLNDNNTSR